MNTSPPLVTIITPSFNQGQFIEATIKSVLAQTYQNIEFILIDALSTDSTGEIIDRYRQSISHVVQESDKGQSDAIVKGFKMAKGELVGWINSDDILYPDCVEQLVTSYELNPEAVLFYNSKIDIVSGTGAHIKQLDFEIIDRESLLRKSNTLIQPGSFYSRAALEKIDYFDGKLRYSMDLDLWLRLLKIGRCVNFGNGPVAAYREWEGTKTATGATKLLRERRALLIRHGGRVFDKTMLTINIELIKFFIKDKLIVSYLRKLLSFSLTNVCLALFYGFFRYLPASNSRYTKWTRVLRKIVCKPLFRSAGSNINVESGAFFGTGRKVSIGDNSGIGVNCKLLGDVSIGRNVMIGPDVLFITTSHVHKNLNIPMVEQGFEAERPIILRDDIWIGARTIILPGVTLGKGCVAAAGSVVTKSFPDFSIVAGNPARVIKIRGESGMKNGGEIGAVCD
ncbi:MAG: glycosyltransferase [Azonexus sp.]|nr:glycosyltransferase [Azonexus sp.]